MKKKYFSNNIDYSPYSQPETQINNNLSASKNRNTITNIQQKNSKNYFHINKEYESNQNNNQKNNRVINSLTEKIYSDNSKKLGEYYRKNKEDISLYGSKKYDLLTVDNLVQEMKQYRNSIIEKIKQNPSKYKLKNFGLKNSNENLILTPLAEKERSKMGNNEKELFNQAERRGVVMRRIEYSNSLYQNGDCDNLKIFLVMKDAVRLIEKCWLFYKGLKKRKMIKGFILLDKYIKRKVLRLINELNNEKLKNIYMNINSNHSSISFKNNLLLKNSDNNNLNNNRYYLQAKIIFDICPRDRININPNIVKDDKKEIDDIQKKYYKLILDYRIIQEESNKYKNENNQLKNKINILSNENNDINDEKNELLKKFEELNNNYNTLLKDFDTLNANNSNLISNQSIIFNSFKNNNIQPKETEEYVSLLNEYNSLQVKYNKILEEMNELKKKNDELNEIVIKNNQGKNSYIPIDEETINEINEYKNKIEELNTELSKKENNYEEQIKNLTKNINCLIQEKEELIKNINILKSETKSNKLTDNDIGYINQMQLLERIKNYEIQIKQYETQINENEKSLSNKEKDLFDYKNKIINYENIIKEYKNKEIALQNKINDYEQKINFNLKINKSGDNNGVINENNNLKIEIDKQKLSIIKYKQDLDNIDLKLNETQKKLNLYIIKNNILNNENNKNKIIIEKLNNLINELNNRIKQLLEENKNIRNNIKNNKNIENIFLLFIDKIFKKKILEYKYQLMINLFQENINNISKYIIYQNNSVRSSINLDGYEKVITGESRKIINKEKEQSEISYNNKIIIHKNIDDTLKDYIIKGKDNLTFDEIFEDDKTNNYNNKDNLQLNINK